MPDLGDVVTLYYTTKNDADPPVYVTPTTLAVTVTKPDGVVTTPATTKDNDGGTGRHKVDITPDMAGTWLVRWVSTGTGAGAASDQFDVVAQAQQIVSLGEVKEHLNIPATDTENDQELKRRIPKALSWLESTLGRPVLPREITETVYSSGNGSLWLSAHPVVEIASVTDYQGATALTVIAQAPGATPTDGYVANLSWGRLVRHSGGSASRWGGGALGSPIVVVYTAGYSAGPELDTLKDYALEHIRLTWQSTQQGSRPQYGDVEGDGGGTLPGQFYSVGGLRKALLRDFASPSVA